MLKGELKQKAFFADSRPVVVVVVGGGGGECQSPRQSSVATLGSVFVQFFAAKLLLDFFRSPFLYIQLIHFFTRTKTLSTFLFFKPF